MASGPPVSESKPASSKPNSHKATSPLRAVFMGTPALAAHILERLLDSRNPNVEVVAVVTRPDRPQGRGLKLEQSEVAAVATAHGLPLLKPEKIKTENFSSQLKSFDPDILIV